MKLQCLIPRRTLQNEFKKHNMIELIRTDVFEMLENGLCQAGAGTYTNCAGKARLTILIESINTPELQFAWAENPEWTGDPNNGFDVPGALVDEFYKEFTRRGARKGFEENGITGGYRFTLIDAYLNPPDFQSSQFKRASYVAVVKWLDHHGLSTVALNHETE